MNQADTLEKIMTATHGTKPAAPAGTSPRVICVTSGKGGVGKTNLTANLAHAFAASGQRVLILDADLNLANIDVLLGITPKYNLHHVFLGEKTLREVMVKGPGGIHILPGSSGILELARLSESERLYFLTEMEELGAETDILLIDTAAGINDNVIYFNLAAQERIVLLTPEPTSLTDAYALIKVLSSRHEVRKFKIVVNMAADESEARNVFKQLSAVCDRFLDTLSLDFLGHIPYDKSLVTAVRGQRLVLEAAPAASSSAMFRHIAGILLDRPPEHGSDGNIKFFWNTLLTSTKA